MKAVAETRIPGKRLFSIIMLIALFHIGAIFIIFYASPYMESIGVDIWTWQDSMLQQDNVMGVEQELMKHQKRRQDVDTLDGLVDKFRYDPARATDELSKQLKDFGMLENKVTVQKELTDPKEAQMDMDRKRSSKKASETKDTRATPIKYVLMRVDGVVNTVEFVDFLGKVETSGRWWYIPRIVITTAANPEKLTVAFDLVVITR